MYGVSVSDNVKQTVSNLSGTWGGGGEEKRREGVQLLCDREEIVMTSGVTMYNIVMMSGVWTTHLGGTNGDGAPEAPRQSPHTPPPAAHRT